MNVPGHAVKVRRFRSRTQIVHALLLPEHPKLNVIDCNAIIAGLGIDEATKLSEQMLLVGLNPQPGTWLLLEGGDLVGWTTSMDDMDPLP